MRNAEFGVLNAEIGMRNGGIIAMSASEEAICSLQNELHFNKNNCCTELVEVRKIAKSFTLRQAQGRLRQAQGRYSTVILSFVMLPTRRGLFKHHLKYIHFSFLIIHLQQIQAGRQFITI